MERAVGVTARVWDSRRFVVHGARRCPHQAEMRESMCTAREPPCEARATKIDVRRGLVFGRLHPGLGNEDASRVTRP